MLILDVLSSVTVRTGGPGGVHYERTQTTHVGPGGVSFPLSIATHG